MNKYKYSVQIITSKNPVKIYQQLVVCPFKGYIKWDRFQVVDSFEKILSLIKRSHFKAIDLTGLDHEEVDKILEISNPKLEYLTLNLCSFNNDSIEKCKGLIIFDGYHLSNLTSLWNVKKNKALERLSLFNCKYLSLPKNFFTLNQFAWLKSKLLEEKNISALYNIRKDISNERIYADIIGSDKPDHVYKDEADLEAYQNEFIKLIEQYKNVKQPF